VNASCIVDEDIQTVTLSTDTFEQSLYLLVGAVIAACGHAAPTGSGDFCSRFVQLITAAPCYIDGELTTAKRARYSTAKSTARTSNYSNTFTHVPALQTTAKE
jgi:hypothetical protein